MKSREIKTLLLVLGTAIAAAVLLAFGMLKMYNPEGNYLAGNLLLDPTTAFSLEYSEPGPKARTDQKFKFKEVALTFFNKNTRSWTTKLLTEKEYELFYSKVKGDVSLPESTPAVEGHFANRSPAMIEVKVMRIGTEPGMQSVLNFSEAAVAEQGDYYRLTLRQNNGGTTWVYFYHPGIFSEVLKLAGEKP